MNNIKVSVIVPVYNGGEYICDTLNLLLKQDFEGYELVIIDDGSTDDSLDLIKKTLKNTTVPHQIIHQENKGVSSARNVGIEKSNGEYLVFVDCDDCVSSNHISSLYRNIKDFSLTQFVKKDNNYTSKPYNYTQKQMSAHEFIKKELNMEIPFHFAQLMYKKEIIQKNNIRFLENVTYGEDTHFALKALIHGENIQISNEVTYYYIQHSDSAIQTAQLKRFEIVKVFENLAEYYQKNGEDELASLIYTSRIPKAIFGNMNFFFYSNYDFDEVIAKMKENNLFEKLSRYKGDFKFKIKIKMFLINPRLYYKLWMKFKKKID